VLQTLRSVSGVTWYVSLLWTMNRQAFFHNKKWEKRSAFICVNMVTCKTANYSSSTDDNSAFFLFIRENFFAGWLINLWLGSRPYSPDAPRP
jgi:hypothetical protein